MEIERKYIITEELFNKFLSTFGTEVKNSSDTYYRDSNDKWLRVRFENGNLYLTMKHKTYGEDGTEVNDEYEVSFDENPSNTGNIGKILTALGFEPIHQKQKEKHDFYVEPVIVSIEKVSSDGKVVYAVEIETIQDDEVQAKEDLDLMLLRIEKAIGQKLEPCHQGWDELLGWSRL